MNSKNLNFSRRFNVLPISSLHMLTVGTSGYIPMSVLLPNFLKSFSMLFISFFITVSPGTKIYFEE